MKQVLKKDYIDSQSINEMFLLACEYSNTKIVKKLLKYSKDNVRVCDINYKNSEALIVAIKGYNYATVKFLLKKGINLINRIDDAYAYAENEMFDLMINFMKNNHYHNDY